MRTKLILSCLILNGFCPTEKVVETITKVITTTNESSGTVTDSSTTPTSDNSKTPADTSSTDQSSSDIENISSSLSDKLGLKVTIPSQTPDEETMNEVKDAQNYFEQMISSASDDDSKIYNDYTRKFIQLGLLTNFKNIDTAAVDVPHLTGSVILTLLLINDNIEQKGFSKMYGIITYALHTFLMDSGTISTGGLEITRKGDLLLFKNTQTHQTNNIAVTAESASNFVDDFNEFQKNKSILVDKLNATFAPKNS